MRNRCFLLLPIALLVLLVVATASGDPKAKAISMDSISADATMKLAEKMGYPKKANSAKKRPTKSPTAAGATAPDELASSNATDGPGDFKHLAGDDLEFIAALEKQFSLYGGKVKIKVERDNSTDSKNPKRTVDGELGYGYSHNGYEYRKPTFMFYPYSQKNIPSDAPGYYPSPEGSSVSVQPSYSYELQPQTYEVPHQPQADLPAVGGHSYQGGSDAPEEHQHPQQQHQQYDEPVIVLRIPGPPKYAAHLQALLQQYLQVRATQYLHLLESSAQKDEYHGQEQLLQEGYQGEHAASPQQQQQYAAQQYEDATSSSPHQTHDEHHYAAAPHFEHAAPSSSPLHQQQQHFDYHQHQEPLSLHHSPSLPAYPNIDDVYQGYKDRHTQQLVDQHHQHELSSHVHSEPEYCPETDYHVSNSPAAPGPPYYFPHEQHHYEPPTGHLSTGIGHSYQSSPMFLYPMPNPIYESPEADAHLPHDHSIYEPERHLHEYEQQLHTSENNPRPTHTQIRYTPHSGKENAHEAMYTLPSIRPYERHPPAPISNKAFGYLQQRQQQQQHQQQQQQQQHQQQQQQQQQHPQQHIQQQHLESSAGTSAEGSPDDHQHQQQQQQQQGYDDAASSANSGGEHREVAITQRPHNYHAHPGRGRRRSNNNNSKRDSSKAFEANNFGAKLVQAKNSTEVH